MSAKRRAAEFVAREDEISELRRALGRAHRTLDRTKRTQDELFKAVEVAAKDAVAAIHLPPVPPPKADKRPGSGEVAIVVLSDLQLGKVTPTYNSQVCSDRIIRMAEKVRQITMIQRADHPVRECRVYLLGDLVEGEMIFPGQAHLIDSSLFRQVLTNGPRILGGFVRAMAAEFDKVRVVGVIGNHGNIGPRRGREFHPESNADAMLYEVTKGLTRDLPNVDWTENLVAGERSWCALDPVGSKNFFLFHGDQIKGGFAGFPWYAFGRRLLAWDRLYGFDYALSGHFHTPIRFFYNGLTHWANGSTESSNTYAAENMASSGEPCQWLLFCHPKRGVTAEYLVKLEDE